MIVSRLLALGLAVAAGVVGVTRGTWAVGGSDSSCYALMAKAFARGELQPASALSVGAPWANPTATFAPGGFIPSPVRPDAASPVCAPGFSVFLAPLYLIGGPDAIFLLTPFAGTLLIYLTFMLGRQLAGEIAGLGAAVLVLTSPVFVFQLVQPMNDVLVAMLWTAIVVLAARSGDHSAVIGAIAGIAILVRPNLAPAAALAGLWCWRGGWRGLLAFVAAASPGVVLLLVLNVLLYGHALQSGYGAVGDLFAMAHIVPNLSRYGSALLQTQLGFPLVGAVAAAVVPRHQRAIVTLALGMAATIVSIYLLYRPLPEWWYLRFLLPALPMMTVLAVTTLVVAGRRSTLVVPVAMVVTAYALTSTPMQEALDLWRLEHRFRAAGAVARERLPPAAVFLSVWDSGSVQYHADREAVVWDSLHPSALDAAVDWLTRRGREPYILIEDWEEPAFRARFAAHSVIGQLDWPPRYDIERRVRIYRPHDRAAYFAGGNIPTEFVWPDRR